MGEDQASLKRILAEGGGNIGAQRRCLCIDSKGGGNHSGNEPDR